MTDALISRLKELGAKERIESYYALIVALRNAWPSLLSQIDAGERLAEALSEDASGRPVADLLATAATILRDDGGGPVEDCLRAKAEDIRAALAEYEKAKEGA